MRPVRIHSSAPTRIDFAGGTLDIWPLYLFHENAQTLNAAITLRAECTLSESPDGRLHVASEDTGETVDVPHWSKLDGQTTLTLVARLLRFFEAERLTVTTRSGSPVGAGLGGSSALNIALCGALSQWYGTAYGAEALMSLALNLEARTIGVPTGIQDFRPAMYGGLAALEMGPTGITRVVLSVDPCAIEDRVVLAYTGASRDSGVNNWEVVKRYLDGDPHVATLFNEICDTAAAMRHALEARDWAEVGRQIAKEWELRKRLAPGVTTPAIEDLIERGRSAGARAAKVCGAGGGGSLIFFADPPIVPAVKQAITAAGAHVLDYRIDSDGLRVVSA